MYKLTIYKCVEAVEDISYVLRFLFYCTPSSRGWWQQRDSSTPSHQFHTSWYYKAIVLGAKCRL